MHSTKWLSQNPGRALYYSSASDWLREFQQKTFGGRQAVALARREDGPRKKKDYYVHKTDRRWVKH